ncbi:hypothetical protein ANN_10293 [Periplaneta americana]|uniref:Uncharacterized protein n=1 Tax=Periplaneta americana TaxID=6978 RepID=A0ABQ8TRS3_PERAM|nr:hypothetical protein ANN_10293 [Periplaneta americana]
MRLYTNRWTHILTTWDPRIGKRNAGRHKTRSGLSANDDSGYNCSANDRSAFYRYKTASSYGLARSMWTCVPRKKSILSRLRTSHNIRDIAPDTVVRGNFDIGGYFDNHFDRLLKSNSCERYQNAANFGSRVGSPVKLVMR